ncbi:MAG: phosphatidylserine decarboxylase [Spirochaetales bacterium]|nr:phosphatidylserine decarboxylase [Spirochaetales bacterium]
MGFHYTKYGKRELLLLLCITLLALSVCMLLFSGAPGRVKLVLGLLVLLTGGAVSLFFRNPPRPSPQGEDTLLAPADGKIIALENPSPEEFPWFEGEELFKIGIFLSIWDVHINRAPWAIEIKDLEYRRGGHLNARNPLSSSRNESCTLYGRTEGSIPGIPLAVRQISGAVARRIVCDTAPGHRLIRGEAYGMIKFGSRTELLIPRRFLKELRVALGDRVKAGQSILAVIQKEKE